ncbi:phosphate starvation-inducible protein PhoH [Mycobacterium celatum]|uniref:PhoH-like protein n=1 Tax=Mycobacterium celatum TaxID=28045 RepID=A0A1X1RS12_MYCCE|nr:phosphate starvation-inducible protein PhoH [Mycobacterium celatum]PIB80312.1 phosphate starvation-inducible protein PhoH [Mycobacterium celatum]
MTPRETNAADSSSSQVRSSIDVPPDLVVGLLGSADENLRALERILAADLHVRGNAVTLAGEPADVALGERVISELVTIVATGHALTPEAVRHSVAMLVGTGNESPAEVLTLDILSRRGKTIRPKTLNQKRYVDAIDANTIVFGIGPAGTGKTYLAMAKAVNALQTKQVTRIILTRPAVEAGERLGFLPGTLSEKIDPYLRPLYDALYDMMDPELIPKLMNAGVIEVAPLAYMRGRAQPVSAKVLSPTGFRPIGDLQVGDFVIGSDGRPTEVLGVYPQGFKEIYRVYAQDGASTLASGDHLWSVYTRADRRRGKPPRVLQTKEMIGNLRAAHYHRYELPLLSAPVNFAVRPVPLDPYALGLLLGDGCFSCRATPTFATTDLESSTKFIPEEYLFNSPDVRLAVLQGLLDSDGGPVTQQGRTCRIQFTTVSDRLRDDVVFLVQSLGGVVYQRTRLADGRKPGLARGRDVHHRSDAHILDIRLPAGVVPFRLARKAAKYDPTGGGRPMRFVDRIEPAGTEEAVCIRVAAADSLYVTEDFLLTHNTLNDAFIILDEAQNTTAEQMKMFLTRLGFGSKVVVTGDVTQIDLPGGARSGLRVAADILEGIDDIHLAELTSTDVVRHRLVSEIVDAYAKYEEPGLTMNRAARRTANARGATRHRR